MLRHHLQRHVNADILAPASAAVQRQTSMDGQYPVLLATMSAEYSVLSWTQTTSAQKH